MYIIYNTATDEEPVKGEIYKVFPNDEMYKTFLKMYKYEENDNDIYGAFEIENRKKKKFSFARLFYVEKVENDNIVDNDDKLLEIENDF